MKLVLLALLAFILLFSGCAGMEPVKSSDLTFNQVYEVKGATKEKIFTESKIWIAENFRSSKAVLEYENKDEGTLIGNGIVKYPCSGIDCLAKHNWNIRFTIRADMKDDKFRLTFSNLGLSWPASYGPPSSPAYDGPVNMQSDMDAIKPRLLLLGDDLRNAILKGRQAKDW